MAQTISDECINCGACLGTCPVEAISEAGDKHVIDAGLCTDCGACIDSCPVGAIGGGGGGGSFPTDAIAVGFRVAGVNLNAKLSGKGTCVKAANCGFKHQGTDISNLFHNLADAGTAPSATGFKSAGVDISSRFSGHNTFTEP